MADQATAVDANLPQVTFKKRSSKAKSNFRKRPATPPPASTAGADSDSDFTSSDDEEGRRIKRLRKTAAVTASSAANKPHSRLDEDAPEYATAAPLVKSNDATKQTNWYDEAQENGGDELSAKGLLGNTRAKPGTVTAPSIDGTYKGATNYQSFIQKNPDSAGKQFGPMKAATNIRTVTFTDMAPDVCKDYKKTGYCGFGDSCKFAHMREDYKHGWQLDKDWEIETKGKKVAGRTVASLEKRGQQAGGADDEDEDEEMLEKIPFACIICKESYKNPIVTKCGHYFCESKNPSCAACGAGTGGVFNTAKKLNRLLEKKRERVNRKREQAIGNGEELEDEQDAAA
ncbi:CCCH and RING finger protein (Znf183), putative [Talaromyces stipitatus ATCC 10500]|uniref:Pre-mRNA-splicing factor CWC24 n=1 Tax=Talaromyces stipitatus (strain ATCC 10500 / CBS 375.48 / QM 6759 / NRRL 1006) TaxID=441959 RepID=B8MR19_TALSN|nr:CCCH and RING finger protein (Znf183), putative [Talaromyces stipitatus ATCC 10500]EED12914.1 CCCH and RING finger protein (Znf183), putative [Talaromyces stipitatus ATCC 10500]